MICINDFYTFITWCIMSAGSVFDQDFGETATWFAVKGGDFFDLVKIQVYGN